MADSTSEQAVRYPIADKTVLVTGAARRIGQAVTRELAYLGARVILHYNTSREEVNRVAEAIQMAGGHACAIQADLSQPGQAEALITRAINQAGPIDILINSAAIFPDDRLTRISAFT